MPGALPDGNPVPAAGTLPDSALAGLGERPFGLYVHVPFCTTRSGYCDFNTYTAAEEHRADREIHDMPITGPIAGLITGQYPPGEPDLGDGQVRIAA